MCKTRTTLSWAIVLFVLGSLAIGGEAVVSPLNKAQDLDLSGRIVYAINFGDNGNPTVGGIVFSQDQECPNVTLVAAGEGPATWWGPYPGTNSVGLNQLLNGLAFGSGTPSQVSIDISEIPVGKSYLLQLIGYEPENHGRNVDIFVENEAIITGLNPIAEQGNVVGQGGSVVKYRFTAGDPILNIEITSHDNACAISGLILTTPVSDFNNDRKVDIEDLLMIIEHWGQNEPSLDIAPEPKGDGIIDRLDLEAFMDHWGEELPDPTLLSHWRLDETAGAIACDTTGGIDGTLYGGPVWQPKGGTVKGALQFDGIDDYVATDFVLNPSQGSFSVFAWVKGGGPGQVILSQRDEDPKKPGASWLACDPATGCLMTTLVAASGRTSAPFVSQAMITDGAWHHVGLVSDGVYRYIYVDGTEVIRDLKPFGTLKGTRAGMNLGTGKSLEPGTFWSGLIDDVRFYDRVVIP